MHFPSKEQIAVLRERYPRGTKVELLAMDDPQAPPTGTMGEILRIDDAGQLLVRWETGSSLSLIPGVDSPSALQRKAARDERDGFLADHGHSRFGTSEYVRCSCRSAHGI